MCKTFLENLEKITCQEYAKRYLRDKFIPTTSEELSLYLQTHMEDYCIWDFSINDILENAVELDKNVEYVIVTDYNDDERVFEIKYMRGER